MATAGKVSLIAGNQYSLANCVHKQDSLEPNLTVIHVKLTDSALKAIEEFHKSKASNQIFVRYW